MAQAAIVDQNAFIPTRRSLLSRLKSWDNQDSWREFFDTYWRLVYNFALKAGLDDAGAQDAVQETVISVAKQMPGFKYDPGAGSFKSWLLQIARRRVADQLRQKYRSGATKSVPADDTAVAAKLSLLADNSARDMEEIWNEEWRVRMGEAALERVKRRVRPEQFQMFDLAVLQHWPARKVAEALGATLTQVYIARHRLGRLDKQEVRRLEEKVL